MAGKFRKFLRRLLLVSYLVLVFFYLLACLIPFLNAGDFWFVALLGLGFPILLILMIGFAVFWLLVRSRWVFLSLAALLLSWQQLSVTFALRGRHTFKPEKPANILRVMSWNLSRLDEPSRDPHRKTISHRDDIMNLIRAQHADVLCFQEFLQTYHQVFFADNIGTLEKMGYPYHYFYPTFTMWHGQLKGGVILFSKYPIVDTAHINFGVGTAAEKMIRADIRIGNDTIRVVTIHLQSVLFDKQDYAGMVKMKSDEEAALHTSRTILSKLKRAYRYRSGQADLVHLHVTNSPHPVILCGDFNDVPNSYTYFTIRGDLQDAFLKKGSGIGRTFRFLSPTLRIDYIFADEGFGVQQFTRYTVPYSDHYPIITDFTLPRNP